MNPEELRTGLSEAADLVGPAQVDIGQAVGRVRRWRRTRSGIAAGVATAVAAGVALVVVWPGGPGQLVVSPAKNGPRSAAASAAGGALYVCGEPLPLRDTTSTHGGITLSVGAVRKVSGTAGPSIEAVFTADRTVSAIAAPPKYLEVLYVADGVVVGGGPLLNQPGAREEQVSDPVGYALLIHAGTPTVQQVGERNTLCPPLNWSQVWADPSRYEVVLLTPEPMDRSAPQTDAPTGLLMAKAPLSR